MNSTLFLAAQGQAGGGNMSFIFIMIAIFVVMWFFMIRPQQKKQKEIQKFQNSIQNGTPVVTGGGIYGTVKSIDLATNVVEVEIAKGVTIRVDKGYIFRDASASQAGTQSK
jgi:preprotein translocase subunit YajC